MPTPDKEYYNFDGWFLSEKFEGERIETIDASHPQNFDLYAKFTAIEYQITYNLNGGGEVDNPTSYSVESGNISLKAPEREQYDFLGWYLGDDKVEIINAQTYGTIELSAKWIAKKHLVYLYDEQGNLYQKLPFTIESEDVVLQDLDKDYYNFDGWFDESGNNVTSIAANIGKDVVVYAKFSAIEYRISYDYNGGETVDNPQTYTVESADIILKQPTRAYYTFNGWYLGEEKVETVKHASHGNIHLQARWSAIQYAICYHGVENTAGYVTSYDINDDAIILPSAQRDYYSFDGWFLNENCLGNAIEMIDTDNPQNIDVYAKFIPIEYSITYDYVGGREVDNPTSYNVESEDIVLIATSKDGSSFAGWYSGDERIVTIKKGSHGNLNLVAKWATNSYKIDYRNVEDVTDFPKEYSLEGGDVILLDADKDYYDFVGWYENEDFSGEKISVIKADSQKNYVLFAQFTPTVFTLNYNYNGGLDAQNPSSYTIETETIVLKETSKAHYTFDGWYLEDVKIEKIEQGSHGNMSLEARFTPIVYHVYYEGADAIEHQNPATYTVEDSDFTLLDIQKDDYTFLGWYDKQTDEKVTIIDTSLAKDITLVAKWQQTDVPQPSTPFIVDENGTLTSIDVDLLQDVSVVTIPSSVNGKSINSISSGAFANIESSVKQLTIQEGITALADDLFVNMSKLEKLVLPSTIQIMYRGMLSNCASLCDLTVPFASFWVNDTTSTSATKYTKDIESGYAIGFMYLFGGLNDATQTGYSNFNCYYQKLGMETVTTSFLTDKFYIPDSLKNVTVLGGDISACAFQAIKIIENVVLESDVTFISQAALAKCYNLKEVTIKGSDVSFGASVFSKSTNLATIYVANEQVKASVEALTSLPANLQCIVVEE